MFLHISKCLIIIFSITFNVLAFSSQEEQPSNCNQTLSSAMQYYDEGKYLESKHIFEQEAEKGDAKAQFFLAGFYAQGLGVKKDDQKSFYWMKKCALQDLVPAQYILGIMYYNGEGVEKDLKQAFFWCEKAAMQGLSESQGRLGKMYYHGHGTEVNYLQAKHWFEKAANEKNGKSMYYLGRIYNEALGVNRDVEKAIKWLVEALGNGDFRAFQELTKMKENGDIGVGFSF